MHVSFSSFSMVSKIIFIVFYIFLSLGLHPRPSKAENWVRAGYHWVSLYNDDFPISKINSSLYTHLICGFAEVNPTTYQLSFSSRSNELIFTNFTDTVKQRNPSIVTLLSVRLFNDASSSLLSNDSHRKAFIDSSIKIARLYGFQGLDLFYFLPKTSSEMFNMGTLFREWRAATVLEARNSGQSLLILTALFNYPPHFGSASYPIDSIQKYLNWVHVYTAGYKKPTGTNFTGPSSALYDPSSVNNTDNVIRAWIDGGIPSNKLVFCLPFFGYAWTLADPNDNRIGAPARESAVSGDGHMSYHDIKKNFMGSYRPMIAYNATYVVNYFTTGTSWINFDGVEVVRTKVSYAKQKRLLGYFVWQVYMDDNCELSQAAAQLEVEVNPSPLEDNKIRKSNSHVAIIIWTTTATATILILGILMYCCWMRKRKIKGTMELAKQSNDEVPNAVAAGDFNKNVANLTRYTSVEIEEATDRFSFENKLGEGGFGPVYKGILADGQEIAVKKLSKTSKQGFEEFKNEVMLTAKLQHVNLVRLLGYCIDREQQMLIYEYLPNKSLDSYLFDPIRRYTLDWKKRVRIIEGVIQGLIYLQEYSRLTIIHRDLKVSNILLDEDWIPKISDFGMARIFAKDDLEANTSHVVGTLGYISPEYIQKGMYSIKSDVYSFGILLLQIISGKRISLLYGLNENLSLPNYAYELWKDGKGIEFMDIAIHDTYCSCKLMRCLQIALLCVQENPNDRPSMSEVFSMLKNEITDMMIPKKPAFAPKNDGQEGKKHSLRLEGYSGSTSSVNDITVSEVIAR